MKKLLIALLVATSSFAQSITPQQVLENYFTAIGGRENMKKIQDITMDVEADAMGQTLEISVMKKSPNKMLMTQTLDGMELSKIIFDGEKLKIVAQGSDIPITEEQTNSYKHQSEVFSELGYLNPAVTLTLEANQKIENEDCYVVDIKVGDNQMKEFYSVASGLKLKSEIETQGMTVVSYFKNYKEFAPGIKFPTEMVQEVMGQKLNSKYTNISINSGIADSAFTIK